MEQMIRMKKIQDSKSVSNCLVEIHIGRLIQEAMAVDGHSVAWLAKQLHCNRSNVYKIYQKSVIDTDLMLRISKAMGIDFFDYYSNALHEKIE
jgi:plasmid maintenance system antidote protein VapI